MIYIKVLNCATSQKSYDYNQLTNKEKITKQFYDKLHNRLQSLAVVKNNKNIAIPSTILIIGCVLLIILLI